MEESNTIEKPLDQDLEVKNQVRYFEETQASE